MATATPAHRTAQQPEAKLSSGRIISTAGRLPVSEAKESPNSSRVSFAAPFLLGLVFAASAAFGAVRSNYVLEEQDEIQAAPYEAPLESSIHAKAREVAQDYQDATYNRAVYVEKPESTTDRRSSDGQVRLLAVSAQISPTGPRSKDGASAAALATYRPQLPKISVSTLTQRVLMIIRLYSPKHKEPRQLAERIVRESLAQNYDPLFVAAVIKSESGFNALARSHVGARGLMQIMPKTGAYLADKLNVKKLQLYDRDQNLKLGIAFLKELEAGYGGDKVMTLVAYNWGPGHVELAGKGKRRIPGEVMRYAVKILNDYRRWRGEVPAASAVG